jgi:hypothetical protein
LRYGTIGMFGYGLQIALYVMLAATSALFLSSTFQVSWLDLSALLSPIPALLIALAWLYAGRDKKSGLFTATAVIGVAIFALGIGSTLLSSYSGLTGAQFGTQASLAPIVGVLVLGGLAGVFGIAYFVLETISFFTAGRVFQDRLFRFAGWTRVFGLIVGAGLIVIATLLGFLYALTASPPAGTTTFAFTATSTVPSDPILRAFGFAFAGFYLILTIPDGFALLGFREIRRSQSAMVPPEPATSPQPTPPDVLPPSEPQQAG